MAKPCTTKSLIPTWVSIAFMACAFLMLLATSLYCIRLLKRNSPKRTVAKAPTSEQESAQNTQTTDWESASCGQKFKLWASDVWSRKGIYLAVISHLSDTATDFAAVVEFHYIAKAWTPQECNDLNVPYIFALSITAMALYRIVSSVMVWRVTRSFKRVLLQFIDIELFQIVYISHRLGLKSKSSPQRMISALESVLEAAPQAALQLIYLIKTRNLSTIILVSSIVSLLNLTSSVIGDDKTFLKIKFRNPFSDKTYEQKYGTYNHSSVEPINRIEERSMMYGFLQFAILNVFRFLDIPSQILLYVFMWYYVSGMAVFIVVVIDIVIVLLCYALTTNIDAVLGIVAVPFTFGNVAHISVLISFWAWSVCRIIAVDILIWVFIANDNHDLWGTPAESGVTALWIYCFVASILKWVFFWLLMRKYGGAYFGNGSKERSHLPQILQSRRFDAALELIFYSNMDIDENMQKIFGAKPNTFSILAITACSSNQYLFDVILNLGLDNLDFESYHSALNALAETVQVENIRALMQHPDMCVEYLLKEDENRYTPMGMFLYKTRERIEPLEEFFQCINEWLQNDPQRDAKLTQILSYATCDTSRGIEYSALQSAAKFAVPDKVLRMVYDLCPDSYKKEALEVRTKYNQSILDLVTDQAISSGNEVYQEQRKALIEMFTNHG
eukprot:332953_1